MGSNKGGLVQVGAPWLANDMAAVLSVSMFERSGASASAVSALMKMNRQSTFVNQNGYSEAPAAKDSAMNSDQTDIIAAAIATSPVIKRCQ